MEALHFPRLFVILFCHEKSIGENRVGVKFRIKLKLPIHKRNALLLTRSKVRWLRKMREGAQGEFQTLRKTTKSYVIVCKSFLVFGRARGSIAFS